MEEVHDLPTHGGAATSLLASPGRPDHSGGRDLAYGVQGWQGSVVLPLTDNGRGLDGEYYTDQDLAGLEWHATGPQHRRGIYWVGPPLVGLGPPWQTPWALKGVGGDPSARTWRRDLL